MKKSFLTAVLLLAVAPLALAGMTDVSLTKVYPKVFAPDAASSINRVRFYIDNPEGNEVSIRIFDMAGNQVRQTVDWENNGTMYWDGRDQSGGLVSSGVYIYQLEADSKILTGTVVVSR